MFKKILSIFLILCMSFSMGASLPQSPDYELGKVEGRHDGQAAASPWWMLSGTAGVAVGLTFADYAFLAGSGCALGIAVAYFFPGNIPSEKIIGKSSDYAEAYSREFIKAKRWRQVFYSSSVVLSAGLGMIFGISLAVLLPGFYID